MEAPLSSRATPTKTPTGNRNRPLANRWDTFCVPPTSLGPVLRKPNPTPVNTASETSCTLKQRNRKWDQDHVSLAGAGTVVDCRRCLWGQYMKASLFYRIAAVLLLLFAVAHTLGFQQSDPAWGVDTLLGSMRSIHFDVQGFSRTYWDLFLAAGLSVGVFYVFSALLAWQLSSLAAETLAVMRVTVWAFAFCFAAITVVSWRYLFILPIAFSIVITLCLTAAAWLSAKQVSMPPLR